MKTAGYCALLAVALGLFVVMCAILRDDVITHNLAVRGQTENSARTAVPEPLRASTPDSTSKGL
ncbi:hypothetical protein WKR88_17220 [Trinickia caryophylli]|uniref:Uncharacterized protein n=1 Tax=Trinickia caryophylli TaxID=28094 RepID=A0A1X7G433_TRICW|nr:hypothetical protein [Trinickia caryophylli]TRX14224.1 hypothetical protein FNF07_23250 [Trinickia caryophylli]WQE14050.1 hypothetical protein U0034_25460 [Trinickia caryophylli]GLU33461.1 hypothetical protein Busp01_33030 [Trinickia caryophylli]SMF63111.1 hypothetical protein SAMN06295900_11370 [Trinickia caryophylli]